MKGRSRWYPRAANPVHVGWYECGVLLSSMQKRLFSMMLYWDGVGFVVDSPLIRVRAWRGQSKAAYLASTGEAQ